MGSANNLMHQQASFFTIIAPRKFDFNFCTTIQNDNNKFDNTWTRFTFQEDLILFLEKYGKLPTTNLQAIMDAEMELNDLKKTECCTMF